MILHRPSLLLVLAAALLLGAATVSAQPIPLGGETRVPPLNDRDEYFGDVAIAGDSSFAVTWTKEVTVTNSEVFTRRFDADGEPLSPEIQVNTFTAENQVLSRIGAAADGSFVVVWTSFGQIPPSIASVLMRRFDGSGNPLGGEFDVAAGEDGGFAEIAMAADGSFLVAWSGREAGAVFPATPTARIFGADGIPLGPPFPLSDPTSTFLVFVSAAATSDGGWAVAWATNTGSFVRRFDATGVPLGPELAVGYGRLAIDAGGDRVVVGWSDFEDSELPMVQVFDNLLNPLAGPFTSTAVPALPTQEIAVAVDVAGNFTVAWTELDGEDGGLPTRDGDRATVLARAFDADANPQGDDFIVNTTAEGFQADPRLAVNGAGRLAVSWIGPGAEFGRDIFARLYGPNAAPMAQCRDLALDAGPACTANGSVDNGSFDPDPGQATTLDQSPAGPYGLGATEVTLTVTDEYGASATCTGTVTVVDATAPAVVCPADLTVNGSLPAGGATADFAVTATDACDGAPAVVPSPASGSLFPFGSTPVTATATDAAGNAAECGFTVTVLTPGDLIADLMDEISALVADGDLAQNKAKPLITKLERVSDKLDGGQTNAACGQLGAFLNQLEASIRNGTISAVDGEDLVALTEAIQAAIGC